jgi:CHAT domain-containing protein
MKRNISILNYIFPLILISVVFPPLQGKTKITVASDIVLSFPVNNGDQIYPGDKSASIKEINSKIKSLSQTGNTAGLGSISDSLIMLLEPGMEKDSTYLSDLYYNIGVCRLLIRDYEEALKWINLSVGFKEDLHVIDDQYGKGLYNMGVAYNYLCDYKLASYYLLKYIRVGEKLYGEKSPELVEAYSALLASELELYDYNRFAEYAMLAQGILNDDNKKINPYSLTNLYLNIGIGYFRMGDLAKARIYFEEAETQHDHYHISPDENYINIINSLAIVYGSLGLTKKEDEYFTKGIELAISNNSTMAFNMINTYAIGLGNSGKSQKGKALLAGVLRKAGSEYGNNSRYYIECLRNYADYLLKYINDIPEAVNLYSECVNYLNIHRENVSLREMALTGYADALYRNGETQKALQTLKGLLFRGNINESVNDLYRNPAADSLTANKLYLSALRIKYQILWHIYSDSSDLTALEAAAATSELMISLIDKIRINISEEESRIILGDRYRESYLHAIRDFELCYRITGEHRYLEKAFEFTERSKVAGLLAATRELNAIQFHIPGNVAEIEKSLQREISIENDKENPDRDQIALLKGKLLQAIKERDSLVITFEKSYPGYFALKYNNRMLRMDEVPSIAGRDANYLNYVVSDSMLYIFLVNRKHQQLLSFRIDSAFLNNLKNFRLLLSDRNASENARMKFNNYQKIGFDLYKSLIEPVRKYLISDNLLISPDNILSYLPFETLLSSEYRGKEILYRKLNYFMNDYSISYTYSVTFMRELVNKKYKSMKEMIAFAPNYSETINTDSLFDKMEPDGGILFALPNAREEAEYVSGISGGSLYLNESAKESIFKAEAGNYNIVHLAMHTFLNDQNPMNSAMIFALGKDAPEDGLLHTYEVYGIPLRARMVVLSSCNTGSGILSTGEGILSLARGFLYSGSRSVVMSMWEIEDKSGTEVVKSFYNYLKKGESKSEALKKARHKYLKSAGQLRSHPYFWSAMVVYNSPVFKGWKTFVPGICALVIIVVALLFYFLKRRYS